MPKDVTPSAVLVIDDDPLVRWAISETLSEDGHQVVEAPDCAVGLRAVATASQPFETVFFDPCLDDSRDLVSLSLIKAQLPQTRAVLMTAFGSPEVVAEAYRLGAYRVLHKPFEMGDARDLAIAVSAASQHPKRTSMAEIAINASPFRCRWIPRGTEQHLERWTYAICLRCHDHPRVVSEDECGHCACWEPSTDRVDGAGRHDDERGARRLGSVEGLSPTH
jgi:DNA-binding NarL/FixJ family response regulator